MILTTETGIQFKTDAFEVGREVVTTSNHKPMPNGNYVLSDFYEPGTPFQVSNGKIINITLPKITRR